MKCDTEITYEMKKTDRSVDILLYKDNKYFGNGATRLVLESSSWEAGRKLELIYGVSGTR